MRRLKKIIKLYTDNKEVNTTQNTKCMKFIQQIIENSSLHPNLQANIVEHILKIYMYTILLEKFFLHDMINNNINITTLLVEEIEDLTKMDTYQKMNFIQSFFDNVVINPDNEIRNRIKLLSIRNKTICEILKKYQS